MEKVLPRNLEVHLCRHGRTSTKMRPDLILSPPCLCNFLDPEARESKQQEEILLTGWAVGEGPLPDGWIAYTSL